MTDYISNLPNELKLRIVNYAGWKAATQLSAVSKHWNIVSNDAVFWKAAVQDNFHVHIDRFAKDGDWQGAFKTLATGRLFGWGQDAQLLFSDDGRRLIRNRKVNSYLPREVEDKRCQGVVDIQSGASSVSVLTLSGAVLISGSLDGAAAWSSRKPRAIQFPAPNERILQISAGQNHLLALSASGRIWSVRGSFPTCQPAVIQFLAPKGVINNPICSKVVAGRTFSGALIDNHGLFLWLDGAQSNQPRPTRSHYEDADIPIRSVDVLRIPFFMDVFGDASHEDRVVDFAIGEDLVMLVTSSGRVFALDVRLQYAHHIVPMQLVNILAPRGSPEIDRVEGKFREFAVFNSNGFVYLLNADNIKGQFDRYIGHSSFGTSKILTGKATPDFIEEFIYNNEIVDISFGDGHAVALSDTGKVLTWGRDRGCHGALGHGVRQVAQEIGVRYDLRDGILDKPMPVDFGEGDFFAYKVSAGGMGSCALVTEMPEESETD
ncbi:regulator of chromosome condensation 1/beta-lactamase-inhibitor protein II [Pyronema omphalodes]|nr:regulator of chromosome condensation 1/beta-lactamase-inhibitor protein II [Pyronema omphalodes]